MEKEQDFVPESTQAPKKGLMQWLWHWTFKQVFLGIFSGAGYLLVQVLIRKYIGQPIGLFTPKPITPDN